MRKYPILDPISDEPHRFSWRKIFGKGFIAAVCVCGLGLALDPSSEKVEFIKLFLLTFCAVSFISFMESIGFRGGPGSIGGGGCGSGCGGGCGGGG
ncbi:hypothetical protein OAH23_14150 [Verrucomicrobia bacterium]|nr:hypothetical protein [Verrucomicrobiota bacterium]MDB4691548.1 hypothetical protein [Verrucomicrobiota bacterium]